MTSAAAESTTETKAEGHAGQHRDYIGAKLGMWIFIFTELILFGGLFVVYGMYRALYPQDFHHASGELNVTLGVVNTLVLLTSSLTIAMSITAIRLGKKVQAMALLSTTAVFGCVFLVNKFFEWKAKIHHGIFPSSPLLAQRPHGEALFFSLYYGMTGLHGLHVTVGVVLMVIMLVLLARNKIRQDDFIKLENAGLYWHLVDVIWIFLLPLFYLAA